MANPILPEHPATILKHDKYNLRRLYSFGTGKAYYMIPSEAECDAHTDACFWSYASPFWCCPNDCPTAIAQAAA